MLGYLLAVSADAEGWMSPVFLDGFFVSFVGVSTSILSVSVILKGSMMAESNTDDMKPPPPAMIEG
jgi:hypothetical protein